MQKLNKTVIGIDPGSKYTGYAVIKVKNGSYNCISYGRLTIKGSNVSERLFYIYSHIQTLIFNYRPHEFAIEEVFFYKNARSSLKLTESRSAAILAAASFNIPIFEYSSRYIKKASFGYGAIDKSSIKKVVTLRMNLLKIPSEDAADALAVALCHLYTRGFFLTDNAETCNRYL